MLVFIAATMLAALSPDHDDSDVITADDLIAGANAELLAWQSCVQGGVHETVIRRLQTRSSTAGNVVEASLAACVAQESALQVKLSAQLNNNPATSEWVGQIMADIRKAIEQHALGTAVKARIDFEQPRTCRALKYSGGIPVELAAVCGRYGIQ